MGFVALVDLAVLRFAFGGEAEAGFDLCGIEEPRSGVAADFGAMLEAVA
jgi:hypothetical protein